MARTPESTRSAIAVRLRSPLSPMAASKACQIAIATRPTAITMSRVLPYECRAISCRAPDWSLSWLDPAMATCSAIHANSRWMMPYPMKPPRARYSSGLLSAARDAWYLTFEVVEDMSRDMTDGDVRQTSATGAPPLSESDPPSHSPAEPGDRRRRPPADPW